MKILLRIRQPHETVYGEEDGAQFVMELYLFCTEFPKETLTV